MGTNQLRSLDSILEKPIFGLNPYNRKKFDPTKSNLNALYDNKILETPYKKWIEDNKEKVELISTTKPLHHGDNFLVDEMKYSSILELKTLYHKYEIWSKTTREERNIVKHCPPNLLPPKTKSLNKKIKEFKEKNQDILNMYSGLYLESNDKKLIKNLIQFAESFTLNERK